MTRYRLKVKSFSSEKYLTYNIDKYSIEDGFVRFLDKKTNKYLYYPVQNVQIEEDLE